jgi:phosphatidylinositol alpha-1,6-mannosyltransferase
LRIVFVVRAYPPARGGIESFVQLLERELSARHDLLVLAQRIDRGESTRLTDSLRPPPRFPAFTDVSARIAPLRVPPVRRALLLPLIYQVTPGLRRYAFGRNRVAATAFYSRMIWPILRRQFHGADIVHVFGGDLMKAAAIDAARKQGIPAVITPFVHPGQWGDDPASAAAYAKATRVVALLSSETAVYENLGVRADRVAVCGVCTPPLEGGEGEDIRRRFGITGPLVLFVGVRRPYKGVDVVIDASAHVASQRPGVTFAFIGPGPRLRDAPSEARILDVGEVSDLERAAWLDAADLLALPSAAESFSLSVLEAWTRKVPVVTSDVPALQELIQRSGGGLAVRRDPQSVAIAILELLGDPDRMRTMGEAGHSFWESEYTPAVVAGWHEQLYSELVSCGVSAPADD